VLIASLLHSPSACHALDERDVPARGGGGGTGEGGLWGEEEEEEEEGGGCSLCSVIAWIGDACFSAPHPPITATGY